jgi:HEAT repeat protein
MDYNSNELQHPDLKTTLDALRESLKDGEGAVPSTVYYGLSALEPDDISLLTPVWDELSPAYRRSLMRDLLDASEANFELDYEALGFFALEDSDAGVREAAIELLWENETLVLMNRLITLAQGDEAVAVRAAAASALGRFILLGELGDLPESETVRAQDAAVSILNDQTEDIDVRRRALEAIANCGHDIVDGAVREAYDSPDRRMQISAVFAMGRTYDAQWNDFVLEQLEADDPEMRYEAARAAGELEIEEAVPALTRLALEDDREVKEVAIWSLGEIGSREAARILERLATEAKRLEDDELLEAVEDAIGTASLGSGSLYMMRFDEPEED